MILWYVKTLSAYFPAWPKERWTTIHMVWLHHPPSKARKSLPTGSGTRKERYWLQWRCPKTQRTLKYMWKHKEDHTGILMDPWSSSAWRKAWSTTHTSNRITKKKLDRYAWQRKHRGISLHKTSGRHRNQKTRTCWSPRLSHAHHDDEVHNPRAFGLIWGPPCGDHSSMTRKDNLNQVREEETLPSPRKRARENSPDGHSEEAPLFVSSDEEQPEGQEVLPQDASPRHFQMKTKYTSPWPTSQNHPQYPHPVKHLTVMNMPACLNWRPQGTTCLLSMKDKKIQGMKCSHQYQQMPIRTSITLRMQTDRKR